ncbi:sensor histidine kinase [Lacticaseibacillus suihuaensis]
MLILLSALLIATLATLALLWAELHRVTRELTYVNDHSTNAELTTATRWWPVRRLVGAINTNLRENRNLREQRIRQDAEVHQLLTNLTHDIKTPLTVATGYVQLLQQRDDSPQLVRIAHNLTAVNYYLRYLMDFNLTQEQGQPLQLARVDLTALVEGQLFDAFDELAARGLEVTPQLAPVTLITDPALVRRICQNLIGNWLKYAQGAAQVRLFEKDANHVCLRFANQLPAGTTLDVDHLITRFATGDPARRDSTGLGLSIVAALATRLSGTLNLTTGAGWFTATVTLRRKTAA